MKIIQSTYQPFLTLDYIVNESENKLFDRKSSRIKPSDLAPIISAFANAEGGTIVIGIDDKTKAIEGISAFISSQLREFVALNPSTGKFQSVPEYPEFAWLEGIVNAVTHREYALAGRYILVSMYDDRLEIESPGKLPSIVTLDNIKETRYSRNPRIARILTDFGWVRELNEGVKRIYSDMEKFFLDDPVYSEPGQSVRLVLKNNIVMRNLRRKGRASEFIGEDLWAKLDDVDHEILAYLASNIKVRKSELVDHTKKSNSTISSHLKTLVDNGLVKPNGGLHDPGRTYSIITKDNE